MRILLGFGDSQLLEPGIADDLAEDVRQRLRREDDRAVVRGVVFGERDVMDLRRGLAVEAVEVLVQKRQRQLPARSARKLKKSTTSPSRTRCSFAWEKTNGFRNSSVSWAAYRALTASAGVAAGASPRPENDGVPGELGALPAFVAVHGVVAADHGRDGRPRSSPAPLEAVLEVIGAAGGRGVAAVRDGVDHDVADARFLRGVGQGEEVL